MASTGFQQQRSSRVVANVLTDGASFLGKTIDVKDEESPDGSILAQVIYFDETSRCHLLFYASTGEYEMIRLDDKDLEWEPVRNDPTENTLRSATEKTLRSTKKWARYALDLPKFKNIKYVHAFQHQCMWIIKASSVAGDGAFAARDFKKGEILGYYGTGAEQTKRAKESTESKEYLLNVGDKVVNGHGATNGLQFINDSIQTNFENNVTIMQNGGFKTRKNIRAGEELLVSYGKGYWSTRKEALKREVGLLAAPKQQQQNHCGAWTMVYMLQELYPDLLSQKDVNKITNEWLVKFRAHVILSLEGKPSFAGGDNSCFIDYIYVGERLVSYSDDVAIDSVHQKVYESKTVYHKYENGRSLYGKTLTSLQPPNYISDDAISTYIGMCQRKYKSVRNFPFFIDPSKQVVNLDDFKRLLMRQFIKHKKKFDKIMWPRNTGNHWYLLTWRKGIRKITVRNNLTLNAVDPAEAMFQTLTEWYEAATMECTVCYTKYSVKQDMFCNVCHNVLCRKCQFKCLEAKKTSPFKRVAKLSNAPFRMVKCPSCNKAPLNIPPLSKEERKEKQIKETWNSAIESAVGRPVDRAPRVLSGAQAEKEKERAIPQRLVEEEGLNNAYADNSKTTDSMQTSKPVLTCSSRIDLIPADVLEESNTELLYGRAQSIVSGAKEDLNKVYDADKSKTTDSMQTVVLSEKKRILVTGNVLEPATKKKKYLQTNGVLPRCILIRWIVISNRQDFSARLVHVRLHLQKRNDWGLVAKSILPNPLKSILPNPPKSILPNPPKSILPNPLKS